MSGNNSVLIFFPVPPLSPPVCFDFWCPLCVSSPRVTPLCRTHSTSATLQWEYKQTSWRSKLATHTSTLAYTHTGADYSKSWRGDGRGQNESKRDRRTWLSSICSLQTPTQSYKQDEGWCDPAIKAPAHCTLYKHASSEGVEAGSYISLHGSQGQTKKDPPVKNGHNLFQVWHITTPPSGGAWKHRESWSDWQ